MSTLDHLRKYTVVVADTGDFESIKQYVPRDATTNPSLILSASKMPQYSHLMDAAVQYAKNISGSLDDKVHAALDRVFVLFGAELLKLIPGRVSTEVDARLSFDVNKQIDKAKGLIKQYQEIGVPKERILIKLSSTWEGIQAAKYLEAEEDIHCNLTLMFSACQAIACAEAGVTLISPFVGRIYDWHVTKTGKKTFSRLEDPGIISVTRIFEYYKKYGYKTEIMGASFRNVEQILGLTGCDLLTIAPSLLEQLSTMTETPGPYLISSNYPDHSNERPQPMDEATFRWQLNEDEMASDKLADGIRRFSKDANTLAELLKSRIQA